VDLLALDRGLLDSVLQISYCHGRFRDAPLRDRCAVACANVEPVRLPGIVGLGGADGRLCLLQQPLCRQGLRFRALELGSPRLPLGGKPGGESLELVHPGPHGVELTLEPVEIRERRADLFVGALQLPQDREDSFGHYDGVTR